LSYYSKAYTCGRRACLEDAEENGTSISDKKALVTGLVFHAMAERFFLTRNRQIDTRTIQIYQGPTPCKEHEAIATGMDLFRAFRARFTPTSFGLVVGAEKTITTKVNGYEFSGRLDLLTRISEKQLAKVNVETGLELEEPGLYVWDWKTVTKGHPDPRTRYLMSIQHIGYRVLEPRMAGFNYGFVWKGPSPTFDFRPADLPPLEKAEKLIYEFIDQSKFNREHAILNINACYSPTWGDFCPFFLSGACERI
jgi:hypothetical protein